jgi:ribosome maturation factor RimP
MKIKLDQERSFFLQGKLYTGIVTEINDKTITINVEGRIYKIHLKSILK